MDVTHNEAVVMAGTLFAAGAVGGAIHGLFLMRLAEQNRSVQTR